MVIDITKDNYEEEVLKADGIILLDYWASWCAPCRMVSPIIEAIAEDFSEHIKVGKINVDEEGELASAAAIVSIPTIMILKEGQVVEKLVGARSRDEFEDILSQHINQK